MRIARDGRWYYQGGPINRAPLVRLFARILRREGDRYFLVTPVEKVEITVEDAPFFICDVQRTGAGPGQSLRFETLTGDSVTAGPEHALRFGARAGDPTPGPFPYLMIRGGMEGLVDRKTYYRLAEWALEGEGPRPGLWSAGVFFPFAG